MIKFIRNKHGLTLFEMTISILVGSMVLVTLMSVLTMTVRAKMQFDYESKMINESYLISEQIKSTLANSLKKEFTVIRDDLEFFELQIDYCDIISEGIEDCSSTGAISPFIIRYDKQNFILTLDDKQLHSSNIFLTEGSSFTFTWNGNPVVIGTTYPTGELTMVMDIQIQTTSGGLLDSKEYTTMLMFSNYK